jgi:suppressor of G2 allele of SKP1
VPQLQFQYGEKSLTLDPLKGEIDPAASSYTVSKIKVEVKLQKKAEGRWGMLVRASDDDSESGRPLPQLSDSIAFGASLTKNKIKI